MPRPPGGWHTSGARSIGRPFPLPPAWIKLTGPAGLVLAIAAGTLVSFTLRWSAPVGELLPPSSAIERAQAADGAPRLVGRSADITVVLFTDYRCPACRRSDESILDEIAKDGRVELVVRPLTIFGEQSELAARAALAASLQGRFAAMYRMLMRSSVVLGPTAVEQLARRSGVDGARFRTDLKFQNAWITAVLNRNRMAAFTLGFKGTPSYLVGRYRVEGAITRWQFRRLVAKAREAR